MKSNLPVTCDLLLLCTFLAGLAVPALADPYEPVEPFDREAPYCPSAIGYSGKAHLPDGALVRVGQRYFRLCQGPPDSGGAVGRLMRAVLSAQRVEGLRFGYTLVSLQIQDNRTWAQHLEVSLARKIEAGTRAMGDLTYRAFQRVREPPGGKAGLFVYLYEAGLNPGSTRYPNHSVSCSHEFYRDDMTRPYTCFLHVEYSQDVLARLMFIGGGDGFHPVPIEKFPAFALDVQTALGFVDVTDELEDQPNHLQVIP